MNYLMHGTLEALPQKGEELCRILTEATKIISQAQGCRLYLVSRTEEKPDTVYVTELWNSKEDHQQSLAVPGIKTLIDQAVPLLASSPGPDHILDVVATYFNVDGCPVMEKD